MHRIKGFEIEFEVKFLNKLYYTLKSSAKSFISMLSKLPFPTAVFPDFYIRNEQNHQF